MRMIGVDPLYAQPANQRLEVALRPLRVETIERADGEAYHLGILDQQMVGLGHARPTPSEADNQNSTERRNATHRLVEYIAAYRIEDHIGAPLIGQRQDRVPEAVAVVDHVVRTKLSAHLESFGVAR